MDHRISKDMISSGMIPSGEKKQEDLSRTQYGTAPSPNALSDVYKKMYEKKEETLNEGLVDAVKNVASKVSNSNIGNPRKPHIDNIKRAREKGFFKGIKDGETQATSELRKSGDSETLKADRRAKISQIMNKNNQDENVDLLSAYRAVYEHHKKDADGNTIPHEDEEINEAGPLAPLVPLLSKVGTIMKGVKTAAIRTGIKVGGKGGGKFVKGAIEKPLSTAANVSLASNMMPQTSSGKDGKNKTANVTAGADLFDIVKGQLLDEGLSEEEIRDIMLTLTPDEILNEITAEFALDASKKASAKSTMLGSQGDKQGMMDKAAQAKRLYDKSAEKRRAGNYKQAASAAGPASKKGLEGNM